MGRPHIQGAVEGTGVMRILRRVVGGGISDNSYDDSTWEGGGNTTAMDHPVRGGWALEFQDDLPEEGRSAELPGRGMPGTSGDEDGNAGALPAPSCPRHRGYSIGGKLPLPTVILMRHSGPPAGPERQEPGHGKVCQGGEAQEATACGGGDEGEFGASL